MSDPSSPVFDISGGNSGTTNIPLVFSTPGTNLQILWTYDGSEPTTGTIWSPGQTIPYNTWPYANATFESAVVYVQAIMYDTVQDTYSSPVIQDYIFTCADPIITQSSTITISCPSPNSLLYYYQGNVIDFDLLAPSANLISNPDSISLPNGSYVFFATTSDGIVYNQNIVTTEITLGSTIIPPIIKVSSSRNRVMISAASPTIGAVVHYTTNGTPPTSGSPSMPELLFVTRGTIFSAIAITSEGQSSVVSRTIKNIGEYVLSNMAIGSFKFTGPNKSIPMRVGNISITLF